MKDKGTDVPEGNRARAAVLPAWVPLAVWPALVALALSLAAVGGAAAVVGVLLVVVIGTSLICLAS